MRVLPLRLACLLVLAGGAALPAGEASPDREAVGRHAAAILACGDRSPGSPGASRAARYIAEQLRALTEEVFSQTTVFQEPVDHGSSLTVAGREYRVYPHRRNGISPATTYGETLTGRLVFAGRGGLQDLEGKAVDGNLIVLDADSEYTWTNAARLGARAIIFRQPAELDGLRLARQSTTASVDYPRFVADLPPDLDGSEAELVSDVRWTTVRAETIVARIRGTQPDPTESLERRSAVMLASGYESGGVVRGLAPGATRAWNAALLLELARQFAAEPLDADLVVVFHGCRHEVFRGLRQLCAAHCDLRRELDVEADDDLKYSVEERENPIRLQAVVADLDKNIETSRVIKQAFAAFVEASEGLDADDRSLDESDLERELRASLDAHEAHLEEEPDGATAPDEEPEAAREGEDQEDTDRDAAYYAIRFGHGEDAWGLGWRQIFWALVLVVAAALLVRARLRGRLASGRSVFGLGLAWCALFVWNAISIPRPTRDQYAVGIEGVTAQTVEYLSDQAARYADDLEPQVQEAYLQGRDAETEDERKEWRERARELDTTNRIWRNLQQKIGKKKLQSGRQGQDVFEVGRPIKEVNECKLLPRLMRDLLETSEDEPLSIDRHMSVMEAQRDAYRSSLELWRHLPDLHVVHLVDLDLSDGNRWFTSWIGTGSYWWNGKVQWVHKALERSVKACREERPGLAIRYDYTPHDNDYLPGTYLPTGHIVSAGKTNRYVNSVTLSTVLDPRHKLGSPRDDAAHFRSEDFLVQTEGLTDLLRAYFANRKVVGPHVAGFRYGAPCVSPEVTVEAPSEGSVTGRRGYALPYLIVSHIQPSLGGKTDKPEFRFAGDLRYFETFRGNVFGKARVPHVLKQHKNTQPLVLGAFGRDRRGRLTEVLAYQGTRVSKIAGTKSYKWDVPKKKTDDKLLLLFPANQSALFDIFDPRVLTDLDQVKVFSATRDASPNYSYFEYDAGTAAIFSPSKPDVPLRILAGEGHIGNRFTLVGTPREEGNYEDFVGLEAGGILSASTGFDQAEDMWQLNERRLSMLRSNGVRPASLTRLHSAAEKFLRMARDQRAAGRLRRAEGASTSSWAISERVYPAVKETAHDVVHSLVIMLLFSVPFALILERLLLAGSTIYRKVGGFAALFTVTFFFFFFFHPAFAIAKTPIIIFLSFIIMTTSALVIAILVNRFEYEMEHIRMAGLGLHKVDVSRIGALVATVTLGVSNMRRRPLRTFLTATTVILMTFILMTFASFNSGAGHRVNVNNHTPGYNAILFAKPGWREIGHRTYEYFRTNWSDRFDIYPHYWNMQGDAGREAFFISTEAGTMIHLEGMVGVEFDDPTGIEESLVRPDREERGFGGDPDWIFLPPFLFQDEDLDLSPGDTLTVFGRTLKVGTIDAQRLGRTLHVNGENVTPLQAQEMTKEQRDEFYRMAENAASGKIEFQMSLAHVSANSVCVLHNSRLREMEGPLHVIVMTPKDPNADLRTLGEEITREIAYPVTIAADGESYQLISVDRLSVAGLTDVAIPLILGGLIIFATMLSSVAERGKEIFIYASLGLAPLHIGTLFLVEASIYAVIGGMGGYMLAQLIGSSLGFLSSFGWVAQPDLNFSSITAVVTMLLVMGTVLVSALYPAFVASKAANPGDESSDFKIPEPDGDRLEIPFPFTVAGRDAIGLLAYLRHYLESHTEASVGCFTAADATMAVAEDGYRIRAKVWLAPFDLGISQHFAMLAHPTDMKAIYAVHISLRLLSGQRSAWTNVLLPYLQDLRQQFLVWRTLDEETRDRYRALGGDREAAARVEQRRRDLEAARLRRMEEDRTRKKMREDAMKAKAGDREAIERLKAAEADGLEPAPADAESNEPAAVDTDQPPAGNEGRDD